MDSDNGPPKSLRALFDSAEEKRLRLGAAYDTSSSSYISDLDAALRDYRACLDLVRRAALFSSNESLEDVATQDLPFLLVNYFLAELYQKTPAPTPRERHAALENAREAYELFLGLLDSYGLLSGPYAKLYERYTDDPASFSTVPSDPAARRDAKVANFRAERELKTKLEHLRRNPRYSQDGDDELVREARLAHVAYCAHMAFQGLEGLNRELDVLAQASAPLLPHAAAEEDERRRRRDGADGSPERLDAPLRLQSLLGGGALLSGDGRPLRPFTLVGSRQELQRGVFRPGHNLPTMSIDEYLEEERRRGGIIDGGGEESGRRPEVDEDDVERADEETMKAREWDEFKEANPRGAGNTLNRG